LLVRKLHSEKELFANISRGDEEAFQLLFGMYKSRLHDFAFRMLKSHESADELVQETFLKIWASRETLVSIEQPEHYLFTVTRNKAIDQLRKIAQDRTLRQIIWKRISQLQNPTEEYIFEKESSQLVQEAFAKLSPQKQEVFRLSRYEGLNHEQIADQLHISKNTVKNHLVSSLRFIREHISRHSEAMMISAIALLAELFV
jgi:RNA polymerase sigma-70 factor (family 1)